MEFAQGWDSRAVLVAGRWVERRPRRPEVAEQLRRETRLMPWLAPRLPLPVPVPRLWSEIPLAVRHDLVPGRAIASPGAGHGRALGAFLRALHDSPAAEAIRHGLPSADRTRADRAAAVARFRADVVPLLPLPQRNPALAVLAAVAAAPADTVVHGDLGPEHVLVDGGRVSGVIDFGDVHLGDAANDLAWPLYGAPAEFAAAIAAAYGVTDELRERALLWHRLGPWYEVTHGMDIGDAEVVSAGVTGVLDRLAEPS
ncbi:aminoglycoside phosphotransferase family protein [Nocardia asteroides]|uniref:aminoglycoside phosphotransferase family protein n=1 Tax=Nocardia asteroides TaxID=1824 RepID=UPI001E469F27|nr:aminoglycoside phosphotransferase family protein [Nocardia asteroides]UGT54618.1 aminoglycoside phosphotransferase family protein [Nocardia asteroides]